jgi:hypothetical protein
MKPFGVRIHLGDVAWAAIFLYEIFAPRGELLSEALDRRLGSECPKRIPHRREIVTEGLILYGALHCANRLPKDVDLFYWAARALGRVACDIAEEMIE